MSEKQVKIFTDSASDITQEQAAKLGITVLPQLFTFDDETYYQDGVDMTSDEFYAKILELDKTPKTAQVKFDRWMDAFLPVVVKGHPIVCVTMSGTASGTNQAAELAKRNLLEKYPQADITIIDSQSFTYVYGQPVCEAAQMAAGGAGKDEIVAHIKHRLENHDVYFLVDTLKWLQKGGRINMATVLVANLMDIHPLLSIRGGLVAGTDKIRGSKNLLKKFFKHYEAQGIDLHGKDLVFIHSLPAERAAGVKAEMQAYFSPKSITEVTLGATIGAHAGPGLTGLLCYR